MGRRKGQPRPLEAVAPLTGQAARESITTLGRSASSCAGAKSAAWGHGWSLVAVGNPKECGNVKCDEIQDR